MLVSFADKNQLIKTIWKIDQTLRLNLTNHINWIKKLDLKFNTEKISHTIEHQLYLKCVLTVSPDSQR